MVATTASSFCPAVPARPRFGEPVLLFGLVLAALVLLGDRLLGDPDTMWHLAVGERIWRTGALPWTDAYSHTFAGSHWIAKEWLSQLILAAAYGLGGWRGVVLVTAVALALLFAWLFAWLAARLRWSAAIVATLLALLLLAPHALARPLVFGLLALFLWTRILVDAVAAGRAPRWRSLGILVVWANLHASFTFAYVLAGLMAVEAILAAERPHRIALLRAWAAFGAAAMLAALVTPYGPASLLVAGTILGQSDALAIVTEWQPLAFDASGAVAMAAAAAVVAALALEPRSNAVWIVTVLLLVAMALRYSRFLDLVAIVVPLIAAAPLARHWPGLGPERAEPDSGGGRRVMAAGAAIAGASLLLLPALAPRPPDGIAPAAALDSARHLHLSGPVYNDYDFGGFLVWEGVPTFVDGRTELFLAGLMSPLYRALQSDDPAAFLALLDRYGVTWALVRPGSAETRLLDAAPGWRRAYQDGVATVFRRS